MSDARLRLTQMAAVMRLEWRRLLLSWRPIWVLVLALLPVALVTAIAFLQARLGEGDPAAARVEFANLYHGLIVRVVLFFGCLGLFVGLIRAEVENRSLHYYLLAPLPRWVVVVGKYLAAVTLAWAAFVTSTALSFAALWAPGGIGRMLDPAALRDLAAYCAMTALGCVGYGALFLVLGTLLKGPGFVVVLFFAWEWFQFLLPPVLKQLSVVHYLKALTPVPISEGPFAIVASPAPVPVAVLQVVAYAAVAVALAAWKLTRSEIDYAG